MAKANVKSIHPLWALLALPAMACLLGSDAGNNLSIVHRFATGDLSLWSWQGLALGCAIAAAPLGFAASRSSFYWLPCLLIAGIGGILTIMSTNTDFSARSASANNYQATIQGLISERTALLESLPSCRRARWCDSQAKERRIGDINHQLASTPTEVDPLATPHGALLAEIMAYLRAFGIPLVVAALGNVLGLMFRGGFEPVKKPQAASYKESSGTYLETDLKYSEPKEPELTVEQSVKRAKKWLDQQDNGRISKTKLKVACKARPRSLNKVIQELLVKGDLKRMSNGQLAKPSKEMVLPRNVTQLRPTD